ncbi:DHA2 family efflux MFS transporter permease subunit [Gryllotalpicola reticulitermitis]|uniref:DHA2 family efflux MFS transporter permease subunit n=1 Tax=Gryllotalpicola reticulitermitis TaxID=1184153 RepID=A0ABV8Q5Z0_9MICO
MASRPRSRPLWLVIAAASLPMFMGTLDNLVVTNALPVIARDLSANIDELEWVINAYALAFASFILTAAALGDRFGRRTFFVIGIALFTVASAFSALSSEPWQLITARVFQGIGAAALMPLSLTMLAGSVSAKARPAAIGIWGGVSGLGVALGPLIGGAVTQGWAWQGIFWINVPVGIIAVPLVLWALPNSFGARVRGDLMGLVLAGIGVFGIVYGIVRGNDAGWSSAEVLTSLIGGGVLLVAFVVWESRTAAPMLPLRLFRFPSFTIANAVSVIFSFGIFGSIFILIQFLQVVQGKNPLVAGEMTMPWTLLPLIVSPLTGFLLTPRFGPRMPVSVGLGLSAIAIGWLAWVMSPTVPYSHLVPPFVLAGIGMGLIFAPVATAVLMDMPDPDHAKASGANATLREIGTALGIAVLTAVFTGAGGQLTPTGYVDAAQKAVFVGAAVLAVATFVALGLPGRRRELAGRV